MDGDTKTRAVIQKIVQRLVAWYAPEKIILFGDRGSDLYLCKTRCQCETDATDRQLDQFLCELYGLTQEEIKIVEETET